MTDYVEVEERGHGGFARVFVVQNEAGQQFAKKVFSPTQPLIEAVGEEHLKRRFKREVKYQSSIDHKNVVTIVDSFLDDEPPYFIMPLAVCTLQDELKQDPSLGGEYKKVLFDVLAGLESMHENGFVHRDLKPANILKFQCSDGYYYAISDFGLLSIADSESSTLTGSNAQGGSQNYAAPELMKDFKRATRLADVYSFGAILHDIFGNGAKRIPYTELSLPGPLGDIVQKCTKTVAARRYSTLTSLREDLYQALDDAEMSFSSSQEEQLANMLKENEELTDKQWDDIFLMLEDNSEKLYECHNIFKTISEAHLAQLREESPELFGALGQYFSDYIKSCSFTFEYCDVLASKAEIFYNGGELDLQARISIGLLDLGVSHNRWYVERKFIHLTGPDISDNLAQRIITEVEVDNFDFRGNIKRMERSIVFDHRNMHPILVSYIDS